LDGQISSARSQREQHANDEFEEKSYHVSINQPIL
jgi:hypothetical protein